MADGAHLLRLEAAAHLEHDRGRGLRLVAREQRALRQHQMHARALHAVDAADGAGKLAFERAQVIDVLDEAGGAERVRLVEDLVADAAALGQAALGELHAQAGDLVLGHQHDGAVVLELVGDRLALQVLDDRGRVLDRQIGEQRHQLRRRHPDHEECEEADQGERHRGHRRHSCRTQRLHEIEETLHWRFVPRGRALAALHPARFAQFMVSVRLTRRNCRVAAMHNATHWRNRLPAKNETAGREGRRSFKDRERGDWLLAILLDARGAQAGEAVLVDRILPGEEFLDRQRVAGAGFLERQTGRRVRLRPPRPCGG